MKTLPWIQIFKVSSAYKLLIDHVASTVKLKQFKNVKLKPNKYKLTQYILFLFIYVE